MDKITILIAGNKALVMALGCGLALCLGATLVVSLLFGGLKMFGNSVENSAKSNNTQTSKMTTEQCAPFVAKYDKKVLYVNGDGVTGQIGLVANSKECRIEANYNLLINTQLLPNAYDNLPYLYNYVGLLHRPDQTDRQTRYGTGVIYAVYQNSRTMPEDAFSNNNVAFYGHDGGTKVTDVFLVQPSRYYELSDQGYQDILQVTVYELIDSRPYMVKSIGMNGIGFSYETDMSKAEKEGVIIKSFNFKVSDFK